MSPIQVALAFPVLLTVGLVFGLFTLLVCCGILLTWTETREWLLRHVDQRSDEAVAQHIGKSINAKLKREAAQPKRET